VATVPTNSEQESCCYNNTIHNASPYFVVIHTEKRDYESVSFCEKCYDKYINLNLEKNNSKDKTCYYCNKIVWEPNYGSKKMDCLVIHNNKATLILYFCKECFDRAGGKELFKRLNLKEY